MAAKPFESTVQDLVYNVDVGIGLQLIKKGLFLLFIVLVMSLYTMTRFQGLKDAEAMEYAQLGRTLGQTGHLYTQCVRPLSLWYLSQDPTHKTQLAQHPDLLHPPVYPFLLSLAFKVGGVQMPALENAPRVCPADYRVVFLNHFFTLATGLLLFFTGWRMFDQRLAVLAVTAFFLSDTVWGNSILGTGLPVVMFWCLAAWFCALLAVQKNQEKEGWWPWVPAFAASVLFLALAFLTRYGTVIMVPALFLFYGLSLKRRAWLWAGAAVLLFLLLISPWLARNYAVCGSLLGLAPYGALNQTFVYTENILERSIRPVFQNMESTLTALQSKMMGQFREYLRGGFWLVGEGLLSGFFFVMFLHRFVRDHVRVLRWCLLLGMGLLLVLGGLFGAGTMKLMVVFWPFAILYGLAFLIILLDRLNLRLPILVMLGTGSVILISSLPLVFNLLPPREGVPYPPYYYPFVRQVGTLLEPNEVICTDMPWATAWYGERTSVLLPATVEGFYTINDYYTRINAAYFTTLTRDKPYARSLRSGTEQSWFPILEGRIPGDFPLTEGFPLNNYDQLFLTDRVRW